MYLYLEIKRNYRSLIQHNCGLMAKDCFGFKQVMSNSWDTANFELTA